MSDEKLDSVQDNEGTSGEPDTADRRDLGDDLTGSTSEIPSDTNAPGSRFHSLASSIFDYIEILVFSLCAVLVIFSLFARLCRVSGDSMNNTLYNGQLLITSNFNYTPAQGDIIVFHMTADDPAYSRFNEAIVKRVIATEGQTVRIDYKTGKVTVNGVVLPEEYAYLEGRQYYLIPEHDFDYELGVFEVTVPEGKLFVMGDNRNNSTDSRSNIIGFVDERRVLGKVFCRLSPFTTY